MAMAHKESELGSGGPSDPALLLLLGGGSYVSAFPFDASIGMCVIIIIVVVAFLSFFFFNLIFSFVGACV